MNITFRELSLIETACRHALASMREAGLPNLAKAVEALGKRCGDAHNVYCSGVNAQRDCYEAIEAAMGAEEYSLPSLNINYDR